MLHRALALLLITSVAACKDEAKPQPGKAKAAVKLAPAAKPAPVAAPILCSRLGQVSLPVLKFTDLKVAEAAALWREALIKADPAFARLGLLLPVEDGPVLSLEIPAGSAQNSLDSMLELYACESRKGEAHLSIGKLGSAFAEDGAWKACQYSVPCGFLNCPSVPDSSERAFIAHLKEQGCLLATGTVLKLQDWLGRLSVLAQESDQRKLMRIIQSLTLYGQEARIDSVWLRSPRRFPWDSQLDLGSVLADPSLQIVSHQQCVSQSGQTFVLSFEIQPVAARGEREIINRSAKKDAEALPAGPTYWADTLDVEATDLQQDVLTLTPTIDPDGKTIDLEIRHRIAWTLPKEIQTQFSTENKMKVQAGETRIVSQELESDGKHWRIHLVKTEVLAEPFKPTSVMDPMSNHQLLHADAAVLEKLQHPAFAGGAGQLETAWRDWAAKENLIVKESGDATSLPFRACGPLSAAVILQELSFRSQMQAAWQDGKLEMRWPQKTKKYRLAERNLYGMSLCVGETDAPSDQTLSASEEYDLALNRALISHLWKLEKPLRGFEAQDFSVNFGAAHAEPYFRLYAQSLLNQENGDGLVCFDILETTSAELNRLQADKLSDEALLQNLKSSNANKILRHVEGAMVSGNTVLFDSNSSLLLPTQWTEPVLMDAASGSFLAPQAVYRDTTSMGWTIEYTPQINPDGSTVDCEVRLREHALSGQQKHQLQAQVGNKPVQSFGVEVPNVRHHDLETKIRARFGQSLLIGRSSVPSEKPGQAMTRERLFFLRFDPTPRKPLIETLP